MEKYEKLRQKKDEAMRGAHLQLENMGTIAHESTRVAQVASSASIIIQDVERQLAKATKLNGIDISFLFFATALQCVRQYVLTPFKERVDDKEAARRAKGDAPKEHSNRRHRWYHPTLEEILANPVPYDAIYGGRELGLRLSGHSHRARTLGHDPLLGWVFGTANIATSTMTLWDLQSYHVKTGTIATGASRDKISNHGRTAKVFSYAVHRMLHEGIEGKTAIATSLAKHALHLKSDAYSTAGLPLPLISTMSPDMAQRLAKFGVDAGNVLTITEQAAMAAFINSLIAMIHGLFYDPVTYSTWNLYEVKTRRILMYSNIIASLSNVIAVGIGAAAGGLARKPNVVTKSLRYLDIGGLFVTIYRLINDARFIEQVKQEFLEQEWYDIVMGKEYNF